MNYRYHMSDSCTATQWIIAQVCIAQLLSTKDMMITCNIFPHTSLQIRSPQALVGKPTQSAKVGEFQLICYQIQTKGRKANNKEIQHLFIFAGICLFCGFICVLLRVFCVRLFWWFFIIWSWNHKKWSFWWYYAPNVKVTVKFRNSDCWISQVDR